MAERLGPWLPWKDAIALSAILNEGPAARASARGADAGAAAAELARVRAALAQAITRERPSPVGVSDLNLPTPVRGASVASQADFSPYRRYYRAHQRAMAAAIEPLRQRVRAGLAGASAELGQLAALDAALHEALAERERHALAQVPALLEAHFHRLREAPAADGPASLDWLAVFCRDMQRVLLAELDLRLLPVEGLLEAQTHGSPLR